MGFTTQNQEKSHKQQLLLDSAMLNNSSQKRTVIRARILGFCMGVRRALEQTENALKEYQNHNVYSLGPLIHNDIVLKSLKQKGLKILQEKDIHLLQQGDIVIIRAHGISPQIQQKIQEKNVILIDCTCPHVKASQKKVDLYAKKNYTILLTGDKNHEEVRGIRGFAKNDFILIQNTIEAKNFVRSFSNDSSKKFVLLSQTTFSITEFNNIANILKKVSPTMQVFNTICMATQQRQSALLELPSQIEAIVVVGGKKSANSLRLFEKAREIKPKSIFIEDATEIPQDFFNYKYVALTAGASTSDKVIEDVEQALKS